MAMAASSVDSQRGGEISTKCHQRSIMVSISNAAAANGKRHAQVASAYRNYGNQRINGEIINGVMAK